MTNSQITLKNGHRIGTQSHAGDFDKNVRIMIDDRDVCLVNRGMHFSTDGWRPAEVNWSACGDRDIGYAETMAAVLRLAVRIARDLDAVGDGVSDVEDEELEAVVLDHLAQVARNHR